MRFILIWFFLIQALLNTIANDNDSHSRAPIPPICFFPQNRRACASSSTTMIFECYPKMCDLFANQGHSLYFGAGAPVVVQQWFASDALRRLYSSCATMSSLFCDFGQIRGTIFELLIKAPKRVSKWRRLYSTQAILSSDISNLGKFVLVTSSLGKLVRVRYNFGQLWQIKLDTLRSQPAPGN